MLDAGWRVTVVREIRAALRELCPRSRVALRGSLAAGTADEYSDIDLAWTVPADEFAACLDAVAGKLDAVHPLLSARSDPESARRGQRLLFFHFRDLPLFWRLDLEVRAAPTGDVLDEPGSGGWSPAASALANAVAAAKAVHRQRHEVARGLLDRGFARVGSADRATGDWFADIRRLAAAAVAAESAVTPFAERVTALLDD
ncbi:nucleotidyltransferase domain-containing protein [Amycolatopsis minnesotensis]|uniref:Polymerase nucleotidyl transferase domain-containing protein n=1 Tax=Amycolatopsis minnesotensis TaxID=337894 RepID=A0ABP5DU67_9PSEU